jgi:hypothetical protein
MQVSEAPIMVTYLRTLETCSDAMLASFPPPILSIIIQLFPFAVWQIVEALCKVLELDEQQHISKSRFYALSLDEASALGSASFLCVHMYILRDWVRVPVFLDLSEVSSEQQFVC